MTGLWICMKTFFLLHFRQPQIGKLANQISVLLKYTEAEAEKSYHKCTFGFPKITKITIFGNELKTFSM